MIEALQKRQKDLEVQLQWIPVKTRPLTNEEKNNYGENYTFMYDCLLPEDEQEVLITTNMGSVEQVTFYRHSEYGCYFEYYEDEGDVIAWMPLPEPYKEGSENSTIEKLEQEPFINKPCVSSGVCEYDKNEALNKMFEGEDTFYIERDDALAIIDKYKESEDEE